ncbi:MAG TPA: hypothetical protein VJ742_01165, partial [Nitrososphaera sp.]|nr:hypothetical protein [Nitrososphaera sp.]
RERNLESYEKDARYYQIIEEKYKANREILSKLVTLFPDRFHFEIKTDNQGESFIKSSNITMTLRDQYASSYMRRPIGKKLSVSVSVENRNFPQKKDGSFSIDKIVAFIDEQTTAVRAREARLSSDAQKLERFKELVGPYYQYGIYGTKQELKVSDNFSIEVCRAYGEEEQYIVSRTTTEAVTAEQLAQILKNEVGVVDKTKSVF